MLGLDQLTIGVIGVGTIASSLVRGICSSVDGARFVVSPRSREKVSMLLSDFGPERITVARDNQQVLDETDVVVIAVLPSKAHDILSPLKFRSSHSIISLMAGVSLSTLEELASPASKLAAAIPLPAIAHCRGVTIVVPPDPLVCKIFDQLGGAVPVESEEQFVRLQTITCVMGDLYRRQQTAYDWLVEAGVPENSANAYVGGIFHTMTADSSSKAAPGLFRRLVEEQTPGGVNQMAIEEQEEFGAYDALSHSLDSIHSRLSGRHDPSLRPAARRQQK